MSSSSVSELVLSLVARVTRMREYEKPGGPTSASSSASSATARELVKDAHKNLCEAAKSVARQTSVLYMLLDDKANTEGCARDLANLVEIYDSWAGQLLTNALPLVRKPAAKQCALVLEQLGNLLKKANSGEAVATDVGRVQEAADALQQLEINGLVVARKALTDHARLLADVAEELEGSIAESREHAGGGGDDDDDDDEMVSELLKSEPLADAMQRLVVASRSSLVLAADADGGVTPSDAALNMLITCAKALTTCADALVASAYEDDAEALAKHAQSLRKVLRKLHDVLAERCGLREDSARTSLDASIEAAASALTAACATAAAEEGVAALSVS